MARIWGLNEELKYLLVAAPEAFSYNSKQKKILRLYSR